MILVYKRKLVFSIFLMFFTFTFNIWPIILASAENSIYTDKFNVAVGNSFYWTVKIANNCSSCIGEKININVTKIETISNDTYLYGNFSIYYTNSTIQRFGKTPLCAINISTSEIAVFFCYILPISSPIKLNNSIYQYLKRSCPPCGNVTTSNFKDYQFSYNRGCCKEYIYTFSTENGVLLSQTIKNNNEIIQEITLDQGSDQSNNFNLIIIVVFIVIIISFAGLISLFYWKKKRLRKVSNPMPRRAKTGL